MKRFLSLLQFPSLQRSPSLQQSLPLRHSLTLLLFLTLLPSLVFLFPPATAQAQEYGAVYIFPDADSRYYTEAELADLPAQVLSYGKNEIFARHGRIFASAELNAYFATTDWYRGTIPAENFADAVFNDYEYQNILTIDRVQHMDDAHNYVLNQPGYSFAAVEDYLAGQSAAGLSSYDGWEGAYRARLTARRSAILGYDWQRIGGEKLIPAKPVAFCDLDGDEVPEMLYIERPGSNPVANLVVLTYRNDAVYPLLEQRIDVEVAGGMYYDLFQSGFGSGGLSVYISTGDESWTDTLEVYTFDVAGELALTETLAHRVSPSADYSSVITTCTYNGQEISMEQYNALLTWRWEARGYDLMASYFGDAPGDLPASPDPIGMTLEEALLFLSSPANDGDTLSAIYLDYMADHRGDFPGEYLGYYLFDLDKDGTEELIVQHQAGVRSAIHVYTYRDGWVIDLLSDTDDHAIYGVNGIYAPKDNFPGLLVNGSGGAAIEYNTYYVRVEDTLQPVYRLCYRYDEEQAYLNDQPISDELYRSYRDRFFEEPLNNLLYQ